MIVNCGCFQLLNETDNVIKYIKGYGRCIVYRKQACSLKKYPNQTHDVVMGTDLDAIAIVQ